MKGQTAVSVPLLDLQAQYEHIRDAVLGRLLEVVESQRFIMGEQVAALEREVAALSHATHGIGCASGTDALWLPLKALRLAPGDEVITTPFTFFATAGAIANAGGIPVFVDIDPVTYNLSPDQVEAALTERTRAIIPVHLYGQMAQLERLLPLAVRHDLWIIEDAAQAIGARRRIDGAWRTAGALGTVGALSFFPSKNLGAWGDGGMMVTQDGDLASRLRQLRTHGGAKQYHHEEIGTNSRLDTLQAAVLLAKVPHLAEWNAMRRRHAVSYGEAFADLSDLVTPRTDPDNEHTFHQYTVRTAARDALQEHLKSRGIGCAVYYPKPLHLQPCFAPLGYRAGQFPAAERAAAEVLSLPIYPELTAEQVEGVIDAVRSFFT